MRGAVHFTIDFITNKWDHPRVCGEQSRQYSLLIPLIGSPPRMRGAETEVEYYDSRYGITPAYAGSSLL